MFAQADYGAQLRIDRPVWLRAKPPQQFRLASRKLHEFTK
ncbi:MAG: hypothetical protein BWY17_04800 [Deltaproteobacteria bacterium ADurb.Bin207]|jgi:hypothetical protein|nr:MAG: hypothetical protein BWY17_04800 [Deltaproteobacteria bacterium ADurb.Bin207]